MIISEKQISQLVQIAHQYKLFMLQLEDEIASSRARLVNELLEEIANQQSEELKEVK